MKVRTSLSVIAFEPKVMKIWGLEKWMGLEDEDQDVLFFGLYTLHDYDAFWYHTGKKTIFWCGSDILNALSNQNFKED